MAAHVGMSSVVATTLLELLPPEAVQSVMLNIRRTDWFRQMMEGVYLTIVRCSACIQLDGQMPSDKDRRCR